MSITWSPGLVGKLCAALAAQPRGAVREAVHQVARETGQPLTVDAVRNKFLREGLGTPANYTGVGAPIIPAMAPMPTPPDSDPTTRVNEMRLRRKATDAERELKLMTEELSLAQERLELALAIKKDGEPKITRREVNSGRREGTAVMLASDWHVEEVVEPEKVSGRNEYNPDVARFRADRYFKGAAWLINFMTDGKRGYLIRDGILWLGGDLITGYIHEELQEANEMSPTQAIVFAQELVTKGIEDLLSTTKLERLVVPCSVGNHGRTTPKRRISTGVENSFEWLMYQSLKQYFRNEPRVEFQIAAGAHLYTEVYDQTIRWTHGDSIQYGGGVGGLSVPLRKAIDAWNELRRADVTCLGHFHQFRDYGDSVVNGSLIGYSPYAVEIKARYEHPRQAFFVMDRERGKCLVTPIWADRAEEGQ